MEGCFVDICEFHGDLSYSILFNIPSYRFYRLAASGYSYRFSIFVEYIFAFFIGFYTPVFAYIKGYRICPSY